MCDGDRIRTFLGVGAYRGRRGDMCMCVELMMFL